MRNFGGVPVLVALGLLLSACSSEPNLIAGDATDATRPSVQSPSAVADDSAPFEVIPDTGEFLETTEEFSADDYPLLRYMEPDSFDSKHPGRARFVLVDDGEPAREGPDQFPLFVIGINAYIAESAPIDYYFSYNNYNQNEFGEIGYGRCRGVSGRFAQQSPTTYRFEEGRNPQVEDHGFGTTLQGCGDMPALTPANIFDGTVELEYGDTDITVISEDGQRWVFQQIPIRSARQRAIDALPTTTAAATTTTEVERTDSSESDGAFESVEGLGPFSKELLSQCPDDSEVIGLRTPPLTSIGPNRFESAELVAADFIRSRASTSGDQRWESVTPITVSDQSSANTLVGLHRSDGGFIGSVEAIQTASGWELGLAVICGSP